MATWYKRSRRWELMCDVDGCEGEQFTANRADGEEWLECQDCAAEHHLEEAVIAS